jgi:penicillin-binding protein 1A
MELGSGSAMAMPIWATYMQKVTKVPNLLPIVNEWSPPQNPLSVELDCNNFEANQTEKEDFVE